MASHFVEDPVTRLWYYFVCLHALLRAYDDIETSSQDIESALQDWGARITDDECA